jgi:hypothetical protein
VACFHNEFDEQGVVLRRETARFVSPCLEETPENKNKTRRKLHGSLPQSPRTKHGMPPLVHFRDRPHTLTGEILFVFFLFFRDSGIPARFSVLQKWKKKDGKV